MKFYKIAKSGRPPTSGNNAVYLRIDHWNDYSFVTQFHMSLHDETGQLHDIGEIKIGFKGQTISIDTHNKIIENFLALSEEFFSVGQSVDFYKNMMSLSQDFRESVLHALRDIVFDPNIIEDIKNEPVFGTSLLRYVSLATIKGQFARILNNQPELTDFRFKFSREESEKLGEITFNFRVKAESKPSTNIHAIIGRNGVGKTTILNGMIEAITQNQGISRFLDISNLEQEISNDYFSSLVSVSFSAFDPFSPPIEQPDPAKGTCYFYIGLKDRADSNKLRTITELQEDCIKALISCFYRSDKNERWKNAIKKLGSDENFSAMGLDYLESAYQNLINLNPNSDSKAFREKYHSKVKSFLDRMSSGHAIVLLTISKLVATVEEKTLVLIDEPESHLHPPLLSAFIRTLSDLLHDRNGVAIIATHSPVVLQEIPKSCAWKVFRKGKNTITDRPSIETFGENVGLITSEVFSLEVEQSGFHSLLSDSVKSNKTYDEILDDYHQQLGFEGRSILKVLISNRDRRK